jgi:hypothetical protein
MPLAYDLYHGFSIQILLNKNCFLILTIEATGPLSFGVQEKLDDGGPTLFAGWLFHSILRIRPGEKLFRKKDIFDEFGGSPISLP